MNMYFADTDPKSARGAGFTLIELLVVIAIIGMLASIVLASLGSARKKGRDARRLADLRELATQVTVSHPGNGAAFVGCTAIKTNAYKCTTPDLSGFKDPSGVTTACNWTQTTSCDYSLGVASPTFDKWEVCAFLETSSYPGVGSSGGYVHIDQSGSISLGCP